MKKTILTMMLLTGITTSVYSKANDLHPTNDSAVIITESKQEAGDNHLNGFFDPGFDGFFAIYSKYMNPWSTWGLSIDGIGICDYYLIGIGVSYNFQQISFKYFSEENLPFLLWGDFYIRNRISFTYFSLTCNVGGAAFRTGVEYENTRGHNIIKREPAERFAVLISPGIEIKLWDNNLMLYAGYDFYFSNVPLNNCFTFGIGFDLEEILSLFE